MRLKSLSKEMLKKVADLLVLEGLSEAETLKMVSTLVGELTLAKRAMEWLPEAFGYIVVSRIPGVMLPKTFHVKDADGAWYELPFEVEPLAREAIALGAEVSDSGLADVFAKIALRSSILMAVNSALNSGAEISGCRISGPAFIGLSAEIYLRPT